MTRLTHLFDIDSLSLRPGQGRKLQLTVPLGSIALGGERYTPTPEAVPLALDVSRMAGPGHALRIRFQANLQGPCMRCLKDASPLVEVEAREIDVPGEQGELDSPYVERETLDLAAWVHDAFVLSVPVTVLCKQDCLGLCPVCAADLNEAGEGHAHERGPDPRWAALRQLKLE